MVDINCISREFEKININIHKFNYVNIVLILIASIFASFGLLTNNVQVIIGSKIIGLALIPFISLCIIIISLDSNKIIKSGVNCIVFILICILISIFIGFCSLYKQYIIEPTTEMISHTNFKFKNVYLELLLSFIAGIGVYYAVIKTSILALVGLILVVSIIPSICNLGLFYGMALHEYVVVKDIDNSNSSSNSKNSNVIKIEKINSYINSGNQSIFIFFVNIFGVFCGFLTMFLFNCL